MKKLASMYEAFPAVVRAQRDLGRARRLRTKGQTPEAFQLALTAFGVLHREALVENPPAAAVLATSAVFLDELAQDIGQPSAAHAELVTALRLCEELVQHSPKLEGTLRPYIDWYRHRVAKQVPPRLQ